MEKLVLFCKSYNNDLQRVIHLLDSITAHNKNNIPVVISVPEADFALFKSNINHPGITLLTDESITDELVSESIGTIRMGYVNQEIVKLTFWKTNISENYFCIDSDCYFIKDFYYSDFMYDEDTPYSVLIEDKELWIDPDYRSYWEPRYKKLQIIKDHLGYADPLTKTCHGLTIFSSKVLRSFEENFLRVNNLSYSKIIEISPYEFSWYNFWLQKEKIIKIIEIEPLFKVFHYQKQYKEARKKGITEKDIARAYLGIVLNSNWNKNYSIQKYNDPSIKLSTIIKIYRNKLVYIFRKYITKTIK